MFDFFNRRSHEDQVRQSGRLPPGQSLTHKFPVLHYGPVPTINLAQWDFRIFGEVASPLRWTWAEFCQLPRTKLTMDIHCVTRWSKFDTEWEGVHLRTLLESGLLQINPAAKFVVQHCEYGFTTNTPLEWVLADNFLLATHYNGQPLDPEHGFPLRGIIGAFPGKKSEADAYFWKGGKWLRALEFLTQDRLGFWEQAGYHNNANIWSEERFGY